MKDAIKYLKRDGIEALSRHLRGIRDYKEANQVFEHVSGIVDFFDTQKSYDLLLQCLKPQRMIRETGDRREYGDFQTPNELTDQVCSFLVKNQIIPQVVIEPTFGKGSFIFSASVQDKNLLFQILSGFAKGERSSCLRSNRIIFLNSCIFSTTFKSISRK